MTRPIPCSGMMDKVIQYAGRGLQLADQLFTDAFEPDLLYHLELARRNIPAPRNGRVIYEKFVRPAMLGLTAVGAHYAISSLFRDNGERKSIYAYSATMEDYRSFQAGGVRIDRFS